MRLLQTVIPAQAGIQKNRWTPTPAAGCPHPAEHHEDSLQGAETLQRRNRGTKARSFTAFRMTLPMVLMSLLFLVTQSLAGNAELLFDAGNKAYTDGDYDGAILKYEEVVQQGYSGGPLFYNLGNAWYKQGRLGKAILYWEKAARITGEEGDLAANLKIAREKVSDKLDDSVQLPIWGWFDRLRDRFSSPLVAWGSIILSFLLFGLLAVRRWVLVGSEWQAKLKAGAWVVGILLALGLGQLALKAHDETARLQGVMIAPEAEVLSAPALGTGKLLFNLHEGTKVRVVRKLEGWFEINAGKEKQGWVKDDALGVI